MKKIKYLLLLIPLLFISKVKALTFDDFEVTWYYRNKSNESQLLNVLKQEDVPLYASTNEYVNGYTTRVEQTFTKQIQYIVNYQLQMWFSPEQELNYRSDTLQRIIDYSYVDSDFKVLNTLATENWNRSSGTGDTVLTINVSMQVLALNNTNAIRFGVYTNNNISIGFYNHSDYINYYLVNNISIEENANATIIDQNNQIINGQNQLKDDINNSTNTITGEIQDMQDNIIDSNNQTQDVIKDQFNSCNDKEISINFNNQYNFNTIGYIDTTNNIIDNNQYRISEYIKLKPGSTFTITESNYGAVWNLCYYDENKNILSCTSQTSKSYIFPNNATYLRFNAYVVSGKNTTFKGLICSNKLDETNDKLDNISGALTDDSPTDMSGLEDSIGWLPPGPVDSILTLPLALFNSLSINLSNKTCITASLELPFVNKSLNLPCVKSLYEKIGITGTLFQTTGIIASCFILFNYLLALYKWIDDTLTLRENTMPGYYEDNWGGGA